MAAFVPSYPYFDNNVTRSLIDDRRPAPVYGWQNELALRFLETYSGNAKYPFQFVQNFQTFHNYVTKQTSHFSESDRLADKTVYNPSKVGVFLSVTPVQRTQGDGFYTVQNAKMEENGQITHTGKCSIIRADYGASQVMSSPITSENRQRLFDEYNANVTSCSATEERFDLQILYFVVSDSSVGVDDEVRVNIVPCLMFDPASMQRDVRYIIPILKDTYGGTTGVIKQWLSRHGVKPGNINVPDLASAMACDTSSTDASLAGAVHAVNGSVVYFLRVLFGLKDINSMFNQNADDEYDDADFGGSGADMGGNASGIPSVRDAYDAQEFTEKLDTLFNHIFTPFRKSMVMYSNSHLMSSMSTLADNMNEMLLNQKYETRRYVKSIEERSQSQESSRHSRGTRDMLDIGHLYTMPIFGFTLAAIEKHGFRKWVDSSMSSINEDLVSYFDHSSSIDRREKSIEEAKATARKLHPRWAREALNVRARVEGSRRLMEHYKSFANSLITAISHKQGAAAPSFNFDRSSKGFIDFSEL